MEQNQYPKLAEIFAQYEQDNPKPASVTPAIPQGQQLGTIDKLAQAVIPKLVDKLNLANWEIARLQAMCEYQQVCINDLYKMYNERLLAWLNEADERFKALESVPKKQRAPASRLRAHSLMWCSIWVMRLVRRVTPMSWLILSIGLKSQSRQRLQNGFQTKLGGSKCLI